MYIVILLNYNAFPVLFLSISNSYLCSELRGAIEQQTGYYSLRHIKAATRNFDNANKVGEGGFGSVYKVCKFLPDRVSLSHQHIHIIHRPPVNRLPINSFNIEAVFTLFMRVQAML